MEIRPFRQEDCEAVITLWERCSLLHACYDAELEIERKLNRDDDLFLVAEVGAEIVGTLMGGYDGRCGSASYLCVHPEFRGRGFANALMNRLEKRLIARGCARINLIMEDMSSTLVDFYEKLNYEFQDVVLISKRLIDEKKY